MDDVLVAWKVVIWVEIVKRDVIVVAGIITCRSAAQKIVIRLDNPEAQIKDKLWVQILLYYTQDVKNCVLLQTARAWVRNINENSSVNVRILLDSCSQKSYVTRRLEEQIGSTLNWKWNSSD